MAIDPKRKRAKHLLTFRLDDELWSKLESIREGVRLARGPGVNVPLSEAIRVAIVLGHECLESLKENN